MVAKKSIVRVCHEGRSDLHFKNKLEMHSGPFESSDAQAAGAENSRCKCERKAILDHRDRRSRAANNHATKWHRRHAPPWHAGSFFPFSNYRDPRACRGQERPKCAV